MKLHRYRKAMKLARRQVRRALSARERWKAYRNNYVRQKYRRKKSYGVKYKGPAWTTIAAPKNFVFESSSGLASFFEKIEHLYRWKIRTFVDMSKVERVDFASVAMLISIMNEFKVRGVDFDGNFPASEDARTCLKDSGFLQWLRQKPVDGFEFFTNGNGGTLSRADRIVDAQLGEAIMKYVTKFIWGEYRVCTGLQRVLLELMHNTNNHAPTLSQGKGSERWWLSMQKDPGGKSVRFAFVDFGVGIFNSLDAKQSFDRWYNWRQRVAGILMLKNNADTLKSLVAGELHASATGKHFRGKGIPGIGQALSRQQISNLKIFTNNVAADISGDSYELLSSSFGGTCVSWELTDSNENKPWTIKS